VIDDYDAWSGCRMAVDEYFSDRRGAYEFVASIAFTSCDAEHGGCQRTGRLGAGQSECFEEE
jgi:hypothetical protein